MVELMRSEMLEQQRRPAVMEHVRWRAVVHYRTEAGPLDVEHFLEEIEDLHERIEAGPHWDAIERIEIVRHGAAAAPGLTVEAAAEL